MAQNVAAAPPHDDGPQYLEHAQILQVMFGVLAGVFLGALDQSIVGVALPRITSELGGLEHLSWVITAYLLTSTAATPLWGKISDLYGRKRVFQIAIIIFLIGSALCGVAQNMVQLILFRAIQGIGGGGLFSIGLAIIGDIIAPRERGRYQGYFGAVFGVSSVAGPLLGGWLTDNFSWRWIFYINLPIGIAALFITSRALTMRSIRREHAIDYIGAGLVVSAVSSLLLYLNWAGEHYGWFSGKALALLALGIVLGIAFTLYELRAKEPIIPMHLWRDDIFRISNIFGFITGLAMFGGIIFLPLYFQGALGYSPTKSGLAMFPMVLGIFSFSILTGQMITRTGRYKPWPIVGTVLIAIGLLLLHLLKIDTPYLQIAGSAFVFGAGLGLTMQPMMVAVQNSVPFRDMGAATSSVTFTRSLGSAIGTAIFGAILNHQVSKYVSDALAGKKVPAGGGGMTNDISAMHKLPDQVRVPVLSAYTHAITDLFIVALPAVALGFIVALLLKEIPLRSAADASGGDSGDGEMMMPAAH